MKIKENIFIHKNPILKLLLGLCPVLAVTTTVLNALTISVLTLLVMVGSSLIVPLLKKFKYMRTPIYISITAGLTTVLHILVKTFLPDLNNSLGVFIPLVSVNCLILSCMDIIADNNINVLKSVSNSFCIGLALSSTLIVVSVIRELIGFGSVLGIRINFIDPMSIFALAPGGFFVLAIIIAILNKFLATDEVSNINSCNSCNSCNNYNNCSERN